jgi:Domain of unknown function (DUF4832)
MRSVPKSHGARMPGLLCVAKVGAALIAAGSFMQSVCAAEVVIRPLEYTKALKNPCKGLRYNGGQASVKPNNPLISLSHDYIRWNTIENSESDGIEKIRSFCNNAWKEFPSINVKVIPRVYLDWPNQGAYWPADMTTGDYSSAQFKSRMVRLIQRLGQLWDNDPRVAFVEMGIIGQWGEQHDPEPDDAMQKLLAETYLAAFKHKLLMRRYPKYFTKYPTLGLYWDSFAHPQDDESRLILAWGNRWQSIALGGEVAYNWGSAIAVFGNSPTTTVSTPSYYNRVVNSSRRLHWNHLGWVAGYDCTNSATVAGGKALQDALGYLFVLDQATYPSRVEPGRPFSAGFVVRNTGSSPMYYNWPVELSLLDPASKKPVFTALFANVDIRTWLPGTNWQYNSGNPSVAGIGYQTPAAPITVSATFTLPSSVPLGEYILALAILDPAGMKPSLRFSIVNYCNGGRHPLGLIGVGRDVTNPVLNAASFNDPGQDNSLGYDKKGRGS